MIKIEVLGFAPTVSLGTRAFANIPGEASTFRLTYLPTADAPPTNEWKRWQTVKEAEEAVAAKQREHNLWLDAAQGSPRRRRKGKKQNASPRSADKVSIDMKTKFE